MPERLTTNNLNDFDLNFSFPSSEATTLTDELPSIAELQRPTELEQKLELAPILRIRRLGGGINRTYLLDYGDSFGVYKSESGRFGVSAEKGTHLFREKATYQLAKLLGLLHRKVINVPVTVTRTIHLILELSPEEGSDAGSIQEYVKDAKTGLECDASELPPGEITALMLFDYIVWHVDRHGNNILLTKQIHAVDNDLTFSLKTCDLTDEQRVYGQDYDRDIPEAFRECMAEYADSIEAQSAVREMLQSTLVVDAKHEKSQVEVEACLARADFVAAYVKKNPQFKAEDLDQFVYHPGNEAASTHPYLKETIHFFKEYPGEAF